MLQSPLYGHIYRDIVQDGYGVRGAACAAGEAGRERQPYYPNRTVGSRPAFQQQTNSNPFEAPAQPEESKVELFIENYFAKNYMKIDNKNTDDKNINYNLSIKINKMTIHIDAIYYGKKPNEAEILKFYCSSQKPKIVFVENAPKKLFKLAEHLDNLEIVNI